MAAAMGAGHHEALVAAANQALPAVAIHKGGGGDADEKLAVGVGFHAVKQLLDGGALALKVVGE